MKLLILLVLFVFGDPAFAGEPQLPSNVSYFKFAALESHCRTSGFPATGQLDAYRVHTVQYYKSGAPGLAIGPDERDRAMQEVESGTVPKSYVDEAKVAASKTPAAQRQMACRNLGQILQLQISIENLSLAELKGRR